MTYKLMILYLYSGGLELTFGISRKKRYGLVVRSCPRVFYITNSEIIRTHTSAELIRFSHTSSSEGPHWMGCMGSI
jgi:hypothetical protein